MDKRIEDAIINLLNISDSEFEKIGEDMDLREYSLNSLNAIGIIVEIEEILGVEVCMEDLVIENCSTKRKIEQLYQKYESGSNNIV